MTAPLRRSGVLVASAVRSCSGKQRYSDDFGARAAGQVFGARNDIRLWVYPCRLCRGWHLTKKPGSRKFAADYYLTVTTPR